MAKFNERLRACRKKANARQEDVSKGTAIAYSTYRRYERGGTEPTLSDASRLADFFNVSLDYLAGRTDDPTPPAGAGAGAEEQKAPGD